MKIDTAGCKLKLTNSINNLQHLVKISLLITDVNFFKKISMKKITIILIVLSIIFSCNSTENNPEKENKLEEKNNVISENEPEVSTTYPYKTAILHYKQKDSKNYTTVYVRNNGKEKYIDRYEFSSLNEKTYQTVIIIKDGIIYQNRKNAKDETKRKYEPLNTIRPDFSNLEQAVSNNKVKIEKLGTKTVNGKKCKVYKITSEGYSKTYYINNHILIREKSSFYEMSLEKIEENVEVDDKLFNIPEGVELIDN